MSNQNKSNQIIILSTALVVIFIICGSLIPIVFGVHSENKQTMSYFGKITLEDIKNLIIAGDMYIKNFIEKYSDKKEDSEFDENEVKAEKENSSKKEKD